MKQISIITGASKGLGFYLASSLAARKHNVVIIARKEEELKSAKKELEKYGVDVLTFAGDISDETFVKHVFASLKDEFEIDILINNAGVGRFCKVSENTRKVIDDVLSASLIGTILMTTNALPLLNPKGKIVNIMSTAALKGRTNETAYCAAKWGERGFTEALKDELSSTSINVISVFPGGINTPFWQDNRHYTSEAKSNSFMNPQELAETIIEAISNKQSLCVKELIIERLK